MRRVALLLLALLVLLPGCRLTRPERAATPDLPMQGISRPEAPTTLPEGTPTHGPTPGALPAPSPDPLRTPTSGAPPAPSPTPLPVARDDLNVLLLGTDRRVRDTGPTSPWRTDTLIVVAIRPQCGVVAMLSVPRDLYVTIPGHGEERINVADYVGERRNGPGGGPALVGATLYENLGIPIHAYARINFDGLERIIDTLGGVTINSDRAINEWMDDWSGERLVHIQVITGTQRMDGQTALGYARFRTNTSDLDRTRRQQQILLGLRDAILRPEILPKLPGLLVALADTVDTDLSPGQVLSLVGLALRLKPDSYRGQVFDRTMVEDWITPEGAMVLLPNRPAIEEAWAELTAPPGSTPR